MPDAASEFAAHAALDDGGDNRNDTCSAPALSLSVHSHASHQRRRVNPESLALRLGPDLVRDLDALIAPGNSDMPSFAVRKELQERYNIDRRHIYDYFHSRGLRVVKEDKHGNPIAANDLPSALPNLRPLRQAPVKDARSHPSHPSHPVAAERRLCRSRGVTKAKPGRPKKNPPTNPKILPATYEANESTDTSTLLSEHSPIAVISPTYVSVNPLLPHTPPFPLLEEDGSIAFNSFVNPLDESFSVSRAIGDIAYAYRHKLVFERMRELVDYPTKPALTADQAPSWNETSPCFAGDIGLLLPHAKPLTWDERHTIYETLSDSLGPAHGIQECQGTYRKHMQARTKLYFEGLVPAPCHYAGQPVRTSTLLDRNPHLGTNEFRDWLSETRFLKRDSINCSSWLHPDHRNANVARQQEIDGAGNKQFRQRSNPHWSQTLDELFPSVGDSADSNDPITDSPVVYTRQVPWTTAHTQGVADKCSAGDHLLASDTSRPSLPIPPVIAVTEIQRTGRAQFHGLSGFPGPQGAKSRKPVVEMDSHPQWLEHVPHVAHSGRSAVPGETQYRSRNTSSNARNRRPPSSPRKPQMRDLDRIWTGPVTPCDARRRTPSAAGDI